MPETLTAPARSNTGLDELTHVWCCDPDIALCGTDVSDMPDVPDDTDVTCVVCEALDGQPCTCAAP